MARNTTHSSADQRPLEVMLVAGEASGDARGAELVRNLRQRDPSVEFFGMGGADLRQAGMRVVYDSAKVAGVGFSEIFGSLRHIWLAYRLLRRLLLDARPALLILIDFPEFNMRLARIARRHGITVLYYISPQVWAWRRYRIRRIAASVDAMAVVFPFEADLYRASGVPTVSFVGHPLVDVVNPSQDRETSLRATGLDRGKLTVALMPGSREKEVGSLIGPMLEAAGVLARERDAQFLLIRASTIDRSALEQAVSASPVDVRIVEGDAYNMLAAADLVWVASGTATLEAGLLKKPMVITYRLSPLSYWLGRLLVRVDHIGMVNIIAGERVVPELIQDEVTAERILAETRRMLQPETQNAVVRKLEMVRQRLGPPGAPGRVADMAMALLAHPGTGTSP
ncbi:MAG: lipid-A-disaccharide synthase [Deltaproteobacteria bacterium]|nr:lipid-A-disaccharide synthase [Deltaproteobacteria bacterium]